MGSMQLHSEQRQQGTLSPKLQHAVRLLQLSSLDFAQTVQQALGRNPFLEEIDSDDIVTADDTEHDDEALNDTDDDAQTSPSAETHDDDDGASEGGDEADFQKLLYAPEMTDPELVIRTSGEMRLSN